MPLTIAVTGGAGHVGTAVCKAALADGHTVLSLDVGPKGSLPPQERYSHRTVSTLDYDLFLTAVREAGCDAMVHLAGVFNTHDHEGNFSNTVPQYRVHNDNVSMSYNALCIAAELGINRMVLASSVNSIGMIYSSKPRFDYLPLDEKHPFYPEDPYSLSKYFVELQSDSMARHCPSLRIATMRFHWVAPDEECTPASLHARGGSWKDLWGFVSASAAARAVVLSLTVPTEQFPLGHETFFIVAGTTEQQRLSTELLQERYPELLKEGRLKVELGGNESLFDCSKAKRMLGWEEVGFPWTP